MGIEMNILILGNTAREHVLAWKFAESRKTGELYCTSPYSGVDTLCFRVEEPGKAWLKTHAVGLVIHEMQDDGNQDLHGFPLDTRYITVDCFTDGHTIVPLPAVRTYFSEKGEAFAAELSQEYTSDLAHRLYHRYFVPHIRINGHRARGISGAVRFQFALYRDHVEFLSVHQGFGELDALVLLPLLRGDLAGILEACEKGTLTSGQVRFSDQACAAFMLGSEYPGAAIRGLSDVAKDTGVFFGAVKFRDRTLWTAGRRALFVCGRGRNRQEAAIAVKKAAGQISFEGVIRYDPAFWKENKSERDEMEKKQ